jgi:hypothetical protein
MVKKNKFISQETFTIILLLSTILSIFINLYNMKKIIKEEKIDEKIKEKLNVNFFNKTK